MCQDSAVEKGSQCHSLKQKGNLHRVLTKPLADSQHPLWHNQNRDPTGTAEFSQHAPEPLVLGQETSVLLAQLLSFLPTSLQQVDPLQESCSSSGAAAKHHPPCSCSPRAAESRTQAQV